MDEQETAHIRTLNEQATKIYRLNKINAELLAACKAAVRTIETLERSFQRFRSGNPSYYLKYV